MLRMVLAVVLLLFCVFEFYMALNKDSRKKRRMEIEELKETSPSLTQYMRDCIKL